MRSDTESRYADWLTILAGLDGDEVDREGASGAWLLLAEVATQDPGAASWQFLQVWKPASSKAHCPSQTLPHLSVLVAIHSAGWLCC